MHRNLPLCLHLWLCLLGELKLYEGYLQQPSITSSARYATYLTGEPVTLQCQASVDFRVHGYTFFKNDQTIQESEANKYRISSAKRSDGGSYSCLYWVSDSRGRQESDRSFPVSLTVLDQPSTPTLKVIPKESLYFEGESVILECEHPPINIQVNYYFHKDSSKLDSYHDTMSSKHRIDSLRTRDSGKYDCEYRISGHQRTFSSSKSMPETITVTALSSAPLLNVVPPYAAFIMGENVTMECVAPSPVRVTVYRIYREGEEIMGPFSHKGLHMMQNITKTDQAEYTCMYWSPQSDRETPSAQSDVKEVYVIDPLRPPLLSSDPPSGRIRDGGNITLYCITSENYERTIFHFLNETDEISSVSLNYPQSRAGTITINMKKSNNTSPPKFSCQYTAVIKGRSLLSPKSPHIEIIVITTGSLLWLIAIGVGAGIVVLIIIVSLVYWVLSGKKDPPSEVAAEPKSSNGGLKVTSL
ncbi:Fc receptor-like protein 5 isoform X2 [Hyperolius riggenbachi]|uniref:Fc receptor-like protein 5 isoform X2 n=1 Tax=Hyperolius riggenbachi TaxID=752182 RepID=UPI0035A3581B